MKIYNLRNFLECIKNKILFAFNSHNFSESQKNLLNEHFKMYLEKSESNPVGDPLSLFYFIANSWKKDINEKAEYLGAFCSLYIFALDLFDDVQDDDLSGKTYEKVGPPIAINNAITLLFLSLEALTSAIELEEDQEKTIKYLKIFNRVSILAVQGQHKDLMGIEGAKTPQEVLDMQQAKTSSISLISECAAIFADCDEENIDRYKKASENMVLAVQIVDDIRDIYGKNISPDLLTDKITYPIACFLEISSAEKIDEFNTLKKELPESIKKIRNLLHNSGAIEKSAETLEKLRSNIHKQLSLNSIANANIRTWLYTVDSLASTIYSLPDIEESKHIIHPDGKWHKYVKEVASDFLINMKDYNPPQVPNLSPWHLPQWLYDPKGNIIYYPDIEGQPEEILPLQAKLLGLDDLDLVNKIIVNQSPIIVAHEFFHYWRDFSGNATKDSWYEEWAANRLAIAYIKKTNSNIIKELTILIDKVLNLKINSLSNKGKKLLEMFFKPDYKASDNYLGYGLEINEVAIVQITMLRELLDKNLNLDEEVKNFL